MFHTLTPGFLSSQWHFSKKAAIKIPDSPGKLHADFGAILLTKIECNALDNRDAAGMVKLRPIPPIPING